MAKKFFDNGEGIISSHNLERLVMTDRYEVLEIVKNLLPNFPLPNKADSSPVNNLATQPEVATYPLSSEITEPSNVADLAEYRERHARLAAEQAHQEANNPNIDFKEAI